MRDVDQISKQIRDAQEFNTELSDYLNENLLFGDKTAKEWKQFMYVKLPNQIDFQNIIELSAELFQKYQQAAAQRDKQNMQLTILEQSIKDKRNTAYNTVRTEHEKKFKKGLAAKSCDVAADLAVKDLEDAISNQKVARDFWKSTCETIAELRKLLEMMGYALANDVRANRDFNVYGGNNNEH